MRIARAAVVGVRAVGVVVARSSFGTLTHLVSRSDTVVPVMVDVNGKISTVRTAVASADVVFPAEAARTWAGEEPAATAARTALYATVITAGIMGCKKTAELIPMCHPLPLSKAVIDISPPAAAGSGSMTVRITCTVRTTGPTGVEMEALTGASIAALTLYDMLKGAVPPVPPVGGTRLADLQIVGIRLLSKTGGES